MSCVVELRDVSVVRNGKPILQNASMKLYPNKIHAIYGDNGAGKSLLMRVLAGDIQPSSGSIIIDGQEYDSLSVQKAGKLGVYMLQHSSSLVDSMSIVENLFLNNYIYRFKGLKLISHSKQRKRARDIFDGLGYPIDIDTPVGRLGSAEKKMVEIVKALLLDARVIVFDETTALLTEKETEQVFGMLHQIRKKGTSIVLISHDVNEIIQNADDITIIKQGKLTATLDCRELDLEQTINQIAQGDIQKYPKLNKIPNGRAVLQVEDIYDQRIIEGVSFSLYQGEILGVTGEMGSGRTSLANLLTGCEPIIKGKMRLGKTPVTFKNPRDALQAGIAYIPEDYRKSLIYQLDIVKNISLSHMQSVVSNNIINLRFEKRLAKDYCTKLGMKNEQIQQEVLGLSNGDKQKLAMAKNLLSMAKIFILDEPTNGLDIVSKIEIYNILNNIILNGGSVIIFSSNIDEMIGMCHRVLVLRKGRLIKELKDEEITKKNIVYFSSVNEMASEG